MRLGILVSKSVATQFGGLIEDAARAENFEAELHQLPADPAVGLDSAMVAQIDVAYFDRELRFSEFFPNFQKVMRTAPRLKWLHCINSGLNQFDWIPPLIARGVRVSSSTGSNAEPVSQIALMGLLMMGRRAYVWQRGQQNHQWMPHRGKDVPPDLAGQTLLIAGLGAIGTRVARFAKMLGLYVIGMRRSPLQPDDPVDELITPDRFHATLPRADFLLLTCPLTAATRNLVDARTLAAMKPTASVINVSRGEVIDEPALIDALSARRIAGAYLDVYWQEPLPADSLMWDLPNLVMSPHNASSAQGNERRGVQYLIDNIPRFARGEPLVNEFRGGDD